MKTLEFIALVAFGLYTTSIMWLWDTKKYGPAVKAGFVQAFWLPIGAVTWPLGKLLGAGAYLLRPVSPRAERYHHTRNYRGRHHQVATG